MMSISTFFNAGKILVGVASGNVPLVVEGVSGVTMSLVSEPVTKALGDSDWADIADTSAMW